MDSSIYGITDLWIRRFTESPVCGMPIYELDDLRVVDLRIRRFTESPVCGVADLWDRRSPAGGAGICHTETVRKAGCLSRRRSGAVSAFLFTVARTPVRAFLRLKVPSFPSQRASRGKGRTSVLILSFPGRRLGHIGGFRRVLRRAAVVRPVGRGSCCMGQLRCAGHVRCMGYSAVRDRPPLEIVRCAGSPALRGIPLFGIVRRVGYIDVRDRPLCGHVRCMGYSAVRVTSAVWGTLPFGIVRRVGYIAARDRPPCGSRPLYGVLRCSGSSAVWGIPLCGIVRRVGYIAAQDHVPPGTLRSGGVPDGAATGSPLRCCTPSAGGTVCKVM